MALTLVSSPNSPAPAYAGLVWQYKDELTVSSVSDSSGNLQLNITGVGAIVQAGEYLWVGALVTADGVNSPVVEVLSTSTNSCVVNTPYAAYASGVARRMVSAQFVVKTGYASTTAQPKRTAQTLQLRPGPDGIYQFNALDAVRSRFDFDELALSTTSDYHHNVNHVVYPSSISQPTNKVALKQNAGTTPVTPIAYPWQSLISTVESSIYKTRLESDKTPAALIEDAPPTTLRYFTKQTIDVMFTTPIADADTITTPSLPAGLQFITSNSGQTLTGIRMLSTAVAATINGTYAVVFDNGVDPTITYNVTFACAEALTYKPVTCKDFVLIWWHPEGGWQQYAFTLRHAYEVDGNNVQVVKFENLSRLAVSFEDIFQAVSLIAEPESEDILNRLNTIKYCRSIWLAAFNGEEVDVANCRRVFVEGGGFDLKTTNPFKAVSNQFELTVFFSEPIKGVY